MENKKGPEFKHSLQDALQDALRSGDYSQLRKAANETFPSIVKKTIETAKSIKDDAAFLFDWDIKPKVPPPGWGPGTWEPQNVKEPEKTSSSDPPPPPPSSNPEASGIPKSEMQKVPPKKKQPVKAVPSAPVSQGISPPPYLKKTTGDMFGGVVLAVIGFLLLTPACILAFFSLASIFLSGNDARFFTVLLIIFTLLTIPGGFLAWKGIAKFGRAKRFKKYWELLRKKGFCEIERLAKAVRKKPRFVLKEITQLLDENLYPEGRLDKEKTCLILGKELYGQYQAACESKKQRELKDSSENAVIAAGLEAVRQIRSANAALPGAVITEKLTRLEEVTANIFEYVEQRPEKLQDIRRFMDYYLPSAIKLVKSYQDFEAQPETATVSKAKDEILATLDVINTAFETLLDGLYQEDAMDVSTDISVLKTMLAQEGLTGHDDFK